MVGRVAALVLLAAVAVSARTPDRDWAKFYGDRWNVSVDHGTRPSHRNVQPNRRGDMSPQEAGSWAIQPIEIDTSYNGREDGYPDAPATQPPRPQPPRKTPQRPPPPRRTPQHPPPPRRTPQHPPPPVRPVARLPVTLPLQGDAPKPGIFINPGSKMTVEERTAVLNRYKTVLQLAEALNKDIIEAKRLPICGVNGPTTTLDTLQSSVGVIQAALEILIRVIRDSFTEVSLATNIYQNLEVVYELLISVKITTEDITSQLVQRNDQGLIVYCPPGYEAVGGQCFYMHTTTTATWHHARTQCKRRGGDLAVPHNLPLLQTYILGQRPDQRSLEFWLGGSDLTNEHGWNWITGVQMDMNNGWNPGEPNNDRGGEDCVMLLDKDYPPLNDARCEKDHLHYICECEPTDEQQPPSDVQLPTSKPKAGDLSECGDEDVQTGPSCFYISSSTEYVTWFKARQACKDIGGSLAQSYTQEVVDYVMSRCGEKRWYWMGPSELDDIHGIAEQQVDLAMKTCRVFDAGQDGQPQLPPAACEGEWHYICQRPC